MSNYSDTARALASHDDDEDYETTTTGGRRSTSPIWQRRSTSRAPSQQHSRGRPKWLQTASSLQRQTLQLWHHFTPWQRAGLLLASTILFALVILALIYNETLFHSLAPVAKRWRELPFGWLILWLMTFFVSFPPMIGYSTCVTIAGFVFGMKGWFIMSTATVAGSTVAFLASRTVLKPFVKRLTEQNKQFAALSLVLKHDGLKLLVMIRLCPLPYSLSNGAISTIPTVGWGNFALATALASPKLLLHIFVGSRLGDIAENGDKMDWRTKMVSYASIAVGMAAGAATGYFIYVRTKARAQQLEAEEAGVGGRQSDLGGSGYIDDLDEHDARDDMSLHTTYDEDLEGGRGYTDDFTDDEDARERDVFDEGDGLTEDEDEDKPGHR